MTKPFTFAERLRTLLDVKGLSNSELAKICEVDRSNITRYLSGKYEAKQDVIYRIASTLHVSEPWLMGFDCPMDPDDDASPQTENEFHGLPAEEYRLLALWRRADDRDQDTIMHILSRYETGADDHQIIYIRHYLVPAAAGYASAIEGEDYELIELPADAPRGADFCISISGDSMEPYIHDGEMVYVKRGAELKDFEPGIFFVDGNVYCKQYCPGYAGEFYLLSANPMREDANIIVRKDDGKTCFYFGKVLLKMRLPAPRYY